MHTAASSSYGNGVVTSLRARAALEEQHPELRGRIVVVDSPCLSQVPQGLVESITGVGAVVFADVCKEGQVRCRVGVSIRCAWFLTMACLSCSTPLLA